MALRITRRTRLIVTIAISFAFFLAELFVAVGTKSLALFADAFHYMNDLIGFVVALVALIVSEKSDSPQGFSFGWQRIQLLGAFSNGVFLLALGISIFLQSIERFWSIQEVENPKLVLAMGSVGLALNLISALFLHEHDHDHGQGRDAAESSGESHGNYDGQPMAPIHTHAEHRHHYARLKSPGRDMGMLGVLIHVMGDALNNVGVIIAALVIWKTTYSGRFYADPGVSMGIAMMIVLSALPLVGNSGTILLQSAPRGVVLGDVKHDLEKIPGIESVHELHIWRLDQKKAIASVHVVVSDRTVSGFMDKARTVSECLHAYGIHSVTLQPELALASENPAATSDSNASETSSIRRRRAEPGSCQIICGSLCENLMCCKSL